MSDQKALFAFLVRNPPNKPIKFENWLYETLQVALGRNNVDAASESQAKAKRYWNAFQKYDQQLRGKGCAGVFDAVDDVSGIFQTPHDSSDTTAWARSERPSVIRWIDTVGDSKFEFLGGALVNFVGATKVWVSPHGRDGGVDFYAIVPPWGSSPIFHWPHKSTRVVGQSKFYGGPVPKDDVKLLITTVSDIRSNTVEMSSKVPDWFRLARGPVVGLALGSSGFQSGAQDRADLHGVLLADNVEIAETIVRSRRYRAARAGGSAVEEILEQSVRDAGWISP